MSQSQTYRVWRCLSDGRCRFGTKENPFASHSGLPAWGRRRRCSRAFTSALASDPNPDVIAGGAHLDDAAAFFGAKAQKDRDAVQLALAKLLAGVAGEYDLVLLDCPPGNELLQVAAVIAVR